MAELEVNFYNNVNVLFLEIYSHWNLVLTTLKSHTGLGKFTTDRNYAEKKKDQEEKIEESSIGSFFELAQSSLTLKSF